MLLKKEKNETKGNKVIETKKKHKQKWKETHRCTIKANHVQGTRNWAEENEDTRVFIFFSSVYTTVVLYISWSAREYNPFALNILQFFFLILFFFFIIIVVIILYLYEIFSYTRVCVFLWCCRGLCEHSSCLLYMSFFLSILSLTASLCVSTFAIIIIQFLPLFFFSFSSAFCLIFVSYIARAPIYLLTKNNKKTKYLKK